MGISLVVLPFLLIFLVGLAELTDLFDGMAARKRDQVTELGKILDPPAVVVDDDLPVTIDDRDLPGSGPPGVLQNLDDPALQGTGKQPVGLAQ